jgi:antitoxin FitA
MKIPIELSEPQAAKLRSEAQRLGVEPQALATAAVVDLLNRESPDFDQAARYVVEKNRELYRRLS